MATGKWIGAALGWIVSGGSILGALAGYCIGNLISDSIEGSDAKSQQDNQDYSASFQHSSPFEETRNSFLFSLLVLSSYVIKADGKVMHSEMEHVRNFLRQNFGEEAVSQGEQILLKLFDKMKQDGMPVFKESIRRSCVEMSFHMNEGQRLQLLNYLVTIAKVDGSVSTEEINALYYIAEHLGLSRIDVDSMLNMNYQSYNNTSQRTDNLTAAYKVLGIEPTATDDEVKAAYRKMALKHHPDRVASLGQDIRKAAEVKFQEINAAKDIIYKSRGL